MIKLLLLLTLAVSVGYILLMTLAWAVFSLMMFGFSGNCNPPNCSTFRHWLDWITIPLTKEFWKDK